jgi:hypothetical protein
MKAACCALHITSNIFVCACTRNILGSLATQINYRNTMALIARQATCASAASRCVSQGCILFLGVQRCVG